MRILLTLITCLLASLSLAQTQQDTISLTLEMVNPNGVIDEDTYFKATLKNETSDVRFILTGSYLFNEYFDWMGKMSVEIECKDGTIKRSYQKPMFCFEDKKILSLEPGEIIEGSLTIQDRSEFRNGMIDLSATRSELQSYKRIRIKLLSSLSGYKFLNKELFYRHYNDLYSSWIDVSNCDFSRIAKPD